MFFEDHLVESSDSEHGASFSAPGRDGDVGNAAETTTPSNSQFPFPGRASSAGSSGAVAGDTTATGSSGPSLAVQLLLEATDNERHCPDILPYPAAIIDTVVAHVAQRQSRIAQLSEQEKQAAATQAVSLLPFKPSDIMSLELQRVQFFLCELLRSRLRKIDALCMSIFYEGEAERYAQQQQQQSESLEERAYLPVRIPQRANLGPNERIVADRLAVAKHSAVLQAGLQAAPSPLQLLVPNLPHGEGAEILPEPELNTYVFGVALEDLGVVQVGDVAEQTQTINAGEIFLMPYRTFRPYVIAGRVRLL